MDKILTKKINLLMHLARIDGKYDHAEKKLLEELLKTYGLDKNYLETHVVEESDIASLEDVPGKIELFYWAMRMIKADNFLHPDELTFCKNLCVKLGISPQAVDYYADKEMPALPLFENEMKKFMK